MKLSDAIAGYWLDKRQRFSPRTVESYGRIMGYLVDYVGDKDIEQVAADDVRRFLAHLADTRNLSKRSLHDAWVPLSSLWTWAEGELGIPHIIRGRIPAPSYTSPPIDPLNLGEVRAILDTAEDGERPTATRDRAIVLTLLDSGLRASELCNLDTSDYDQGRGRLHVRAGKGDKGRYVFLGDRARKAIWRYLAQRAGKGGSLFTVQGGGRFTRRNLHQLLQRLGDRAGVTGVHPHRFRHTFAITFLRNGGNVFELKAILGHESLHTVQIYLRLAEADIEQAGRSRSPADRWKL
jgi:integrase/recombinase XerD